MTRPGGTTSKRPHKKGTCTGCGRKLSIRRDGGMVEHQGNRKAIVGPFRRRRCSGVGRPPCEGEGGGVVQFS